MPPKKRQTKAAAPGEKRARQSKLAKEHNISAAEETEIKEGFSLFVVQHPEYSDSKEGVIPSSAVQRVLTALGVPPSSREELKELLEAVDPDESGFVSYEHFVAIAAIKLHQRTDQEKMAEVQDAFDMFSAGEPIITLTRLRAISRELKEKVDDKLLKDMISEANGGSGLGQGVSLEQFEDVMKRAGVFK